MKSEKVIRQALEACRWTTAEADGEPRRTCPFWEHEANCCREECNIPDLLPWILDEPSPMDLKPERIHRFHTPMKRRRT